jgi:hypothetical protein
MALLTNFQRWTSRTGTWHIHNTDFWLTPCASSSRWQDLDITFYYDLITESLVNLLRRPPQEFPSACVAVIGRAFRQISPQHALSDVA